MPTIATLTQVLLLLLGIFLMIVVLLQRGRGGGLAGAFGGTGGQSAFGTKAGDVFTKITVVLAVAWVIVAGGSGYFLRAGAENRARGLGEPGFAAGDEAGELPSGDDAALPDFSDGEDASQTNDPDAAAPSTEDGTAPASKGDEAKGVEKADSTSDAGEEKAGAEKAAE